MQMLAEQQLEAINETLRTLIKASPLAIVVFDLEGKIKLWSPAAERIFGWSEAEVLDRPLPTIPADKQAEFDAIRGAVQGGETLSGVETDRRRKDGSKVDVRFYTAGIRDSQGNLYRIMTIVEDVTQDKRDQGFQRLLTDVSALLGSSLDYPATLRKLAQIAVPHIADWCGVYIQERDGTIQQLAAAHADPARISLATKLQSQYPPRPGETSGVAEVLRSGKPEFYPVVTDAMLEQTAVDDEHLQLLRQIGFKALVIVPLVARGHTFGALALVMADSGRTFTPGFLALAEELGCRAGVAVDNARLYQEEDQSRRVAERAVERTTSLLGITSALSEALTPVQIGEVIVDQAITILGAACGALMLLNEDDSLLEVASMVGLPPGMAEELVRVSIDAPLPIADAVRSGQLVWCASAEALLSAYPNLADVPARMQCNAWTSIPVAVKDHMLGGISLAFRESHQLSDDDRTFILAIAEQCAQALERARLYSAERQARSDAEATHSRLAFLAEASAMLASSLEYGTSLSGLARFIVPYLADWCVIDMVEEDDSIRRLAIAHADPSKSELARQLQRRYPIFKGSVDDPIFGVLRSGQSWIDPVVSDQRLIAKASDEAHLELLRRLGFNSEMVVPIATRNRIVGAIRLVRGPDSPPYTRPELALAEELGRRAAIAVDHARLYYTARQARQAAERAAERTLRLQKITAALSEALTPAQVAQAVLDQGVLALSAGAGLVVMLAGDGKTLEVIGAVGYSPELKDQWHGSLNDIPRSLTDALRSGSIVWLDSLEEQRSLYPDLSRIDQNSKAWGIIPLTGENRTTGALVLSFAAPRKLREDDEAFVLAIAQQCSQALERARLYAATQASADLLRAKVAERTDELQRALVRAQSADQAKSALLSTVSHEMRTPLSSIIGFSNLILNRGPEPEKILEYVNVINDEARRLANLVNDFLDLQRIEAGREVFHFAELDVADVIRDVVAHQQAAGDGLHNIRLDLPSLPRVYADANRIRQVMLNLLSNASKYAPKGGEILVTAKQIDNEIYISVRDQGFGIPQNEITDIFERFHRGSVAERYRIGGTGLGLALCREIITGHNGRIWAESAGPDQGSTFTFTLPIRPFSVSGQLEPKRRRTRSGPMDKLVLVIEDDLNFAAYLAERLEMEGYFVQILRFAAAKLDEITRLAPSLIVLDVLQGNEQVGWSLLAKLKQHLGTRDVPVMICSVLHDPERAAQLGAAACIAKPVDEAFLITEVTRLIVAPPYKVLVVDDSETVRILLHDTLDGAGYQIETAEDGQRAIEMLKENWPDLIILDLLMPNIDGFGVMEWIRAEQQNPDIPIIAFSAAKLTAPELQVVKERASAYAIKSHTSPQQLLDLIKRVMATPPS